MRAADGLEERVRISKHRDAPKKPQLTRAEALLALAAAATTPSRTLVKPPFVAAGEYLLMVADLDWETVRIVHGDARLMSGPRGLD
jgi:hypothetical protein